MNHTKNLLLALLVVTIAPGQAIQANNTYKTYALTGAALAAGIGYCSHWAICKFHNWRASRRYDLPIAVVTAYADNPADHATLYQELLGSVQIDNAAYSSPTSKYHNYPLVEFVADLDWYIIRLWVGSWLTMPTQLSSTMHQLQQQLQRVHFYCVRHPAYMQQRKEADQLAASNARHVVVH